MSKKLDRRDELQRIRGLRYQEMVGRKKGKQLDRSQGPIASRRQLKLNISFPFFHDQHHSISSSTFPSLCHSSVVFLPTQTISLIFSEQQIMHPGLLDLPIELREKIFLNLSIQDLASTLCLNGSLYRTFKNSAEIQYSLTLHRYGMVDGGTSWSIIDKLAELLRREEAWRILDLSRRATVKMPQQSTIDVRSHSLSSRDVSLIISDQSSLRLTHAFLPEKIAEQTKSPFIKDNSRLAFPIRLLIDQRFLSDAPEEYEATPRL